MRSRRAFTAYLAVLITLGTALVHAQQLPTPQPQNPSWPSLQQDLANWHGKLLLVTTAHPGKRVACDIAAITETSISCHRDSHANTLYPQDQIAAILLPGHRQPWGFGPFLAFMASGGVAFAANFFGVGLLAASIPLGYIAAVLLVGALLCASDKGAESRSEVLLYQRPNTPLAVHLH